MPKNVHNTLKCTNDTNNNSVMKKTIYTKMNYWNGYMDTKTETVKNEDIPMFMSFSELNVYELSPLLKPENELKLIEYLIKKASEFNLQNPKK
jgi:hypothetical protein